MNKEYQNTLRNCPFCGGEVELIKFYESIDGRGDRYPTIKCKCGLEMNLTFEEVCKIKDDSNYTGGYYSNNKDLWNGMHQRLIDKWNTRKPMDNIIEQLLESYSCYVGSLEMISLDTAIKIVKKGGQNA